jgi:CheY-like chemotaxis protein
MQALSALAGRPTVLVVDDEQSIRQLIAVTLELEGLRVLQAEDGLRALEIARAEPVALITLDVMMPGMDGWELAAALDDDPRLRDVPRMMVSGKPLTELERAPGRTRAAAVLSKPFDLAGFVDIVWSLLRPGLPKAPDNP